MNPRNRHANLTGHPTLDPALSAGGIELLVQRPERGLMGAYTGRLNAARVPPASAEHFWRKKSKSRPDLKGLLLENIPQATEYSDDEALGDPIEIIKLVKAFPVLDKLLADNLRPDPDGGLAAGAAADDDEPTVRFGRKRMEGRFDLLHLAFITSRDPALWSWHRNWRSTSVWQECGFDERPEYETIRTRFIEFEELEVRGFLLAARHLIGNAKKHDRLIGTLLVVDETRFDSVSQHEHCCPDPDKCEALWEQQKKELASGSATGPVRYLRRASDETYNEAKAKEVDGPELVDGEIPETIAPSLGEVDGFMYRLVAGHLYRTRDLTGGLRKYTGSRNESWHGGQLQAAVDFRYRTAIDYQVFAADQQPYDHLSELYENIELATGERPLAMSFDGLYATKPVAEFLCRRGTQHVKPHTHRESPERIDMRCDVFDEHQVIRCPSCGSETEHEPYFVFQNGDPRIRVRCLTPHTEKCYGIQSVRCAEHWGWIGPLNYKDRLMNQLRAAQGQMEGFFDSQRKRYTLAGKDTTSKLKRRAVVPAMTLRAEASLFVEWLRLSLRHGWIGSWKNQNTNGPVKAPDDGRLRTILGSRAKRALRFPYGKQAIKLGLAKAPPDELPLVPGEPAPATH